MQDTGLTEAEAPIMCKNYVAYYRVSTEKQGRSGLGLEAQQAATAQFIAAKGADAKQLSAFVEIESGKRDDRPELARAMEHARLTGATLLIAKLDRLSRDAHFLIGLQKSAIAFTACDMPDANAFTVGIMALVAEHERKAISTRTKEALQAAKARGVRLGCPNGAAHLRQYGNRLGVQALKRNADERARGLTSTIAAIRATGIVSANGIAAALNEREIATPRGGRWTARSVLNVLARID
jgi:DNA invertase Pin-like site-specific DNA recombinase